MHNRALNIFLRSFFFVAVLLSASCAAPRPDIHIPQKLPPSHLVLHQPQVALVLGGGARGFALIGVIKVLDQHHIPIDLIVGTSAGSIVGVVYADNPDIHALTNVFMHARASDIVDISALHVMEGPITGNALQDFLVAHLKAHRFSQLKIPFIAVTTDLKTGVTVPISSGPIAPAINASSALSPFFRSVKLYGHVFVDGGTTDPVPVDIAREYHPKVILAVTLAPDLPHAMPSNIVGVYDRAYAISDLKFSAYSTQGADVVMHPEVGQTGPFDISHKHRLIKAGELAANAALPQICAILQKRHIASGCSHAAMVEK